MGRQSDAAKPWLQADEPLYCVSVCVIVDVCPSFHSLMKVQLILWVKSLEYKVICRQQKQTIEECLHQTCAHVCLVCSLSDGLNPLTQNCQNTAHLFFSTAQPAAQVLP